MKNILNIKKKVICLFLSLFIISTSTVVLASKPYIVVDVGFSYKRSELKIPYKYTKEMAKQDFGSAEAGDDKFARMTINEENNCKKNIKGKKYHCKYLRVEYPAGKIQPKESGGSFKVRLEPRTDYIAKYDVYFEPGWEWRNGGKLPGLCGGDCPTGSDPVDNGFSARFMWRDKGFLVAYLYSSDPDLNQTHTDNKEYGKDILTTYKMPLGKWITIYERVKLNTADNKNDGILQVWVKEKGQGKKRIVLERKDIRWIKNTKNIKIDQFYFSTFYGGSKPEDFAPSNNTYARFDNFVITKLE